MATVGTVMGSDSDMPVMAKAAEMLDKFGIDYEMKIISAHREPDIFFEWAKGAAGCKPCGGKIQTKTLQCLKFIHFYPCD